VKTLRRFFGPVTEHEELALERERIARKSPHLSLVKEDPRPDATMFEWKSVAELFERKS
jgi:hypothetical protein